MKKLIFIFGFIFSFSANSALIKNTFIIDDVEGIVDLNNPGLSFVGIRDLPSSITWSVIFDNSGAALTTYLDGSNGVAEFGQGDDSVLRVDDFSSTLNVSAGEFFNDAILDISIFVNLADTVVNSYFGKRIEDYDNTVENSQGAGFISSIGEYYFLTADAYRFIAQDNYIGSDSYAFFQLSNSCVSGGIQCNDATTLEIGGKYRLLRTEVLNVDEPSTVFLMVATFLVLFRLRSSTML